MASCAKNTVALKTHETRFPAARGGQSAGPLDEPEIQGALTEVDAAIGPLRKLAPIGRLAENLNLRPLELETLSFALANR